jgi:glycosyltransferase involved in cell wall biosynthesis
MKILLSAYACEPNKGSEPGVGWHWALAVRRRGCDVHVITRSNNRRAIEGACAGDDPKVSFHYYDLPSWLRFWKHWPGGIYLYYLLWQIGALRTAKKLHAKERFDCVQHITFVSFRQPSFMGELGIPFIFGPVGGGETMPEQLRRSLPFHGRVAEMVRAAGNYFARMDPLMHRTWSLAQTIVCATEETKLAIPVRFREKCVVQRAIGIEIPEKASSLEARKRSEMHPIKHQFLFVGRLLYWKGLHLALRALALVKREVPDLTLRIIGESRERGWLEHVACQAGVADVLEWISWKAQDEIQRDYRNSTALIFPSLHDSGAMVVLEAMAAGLPVVCLDLGGPGSSVTAEAGFSLRVGQLEESEVIAQIATAMIRLATDEDLRRRLSAGAMRRAGELTWDAAVDGVYGGRPRIEQVSRAVARGVRRESKEGLDVAS